VLIKQHYIVAYSDTATPLMHHILTKKHLAIALPFRF
jgi:hypothetical protein